MRPALPTARGAAQLCARCRLQPRRDITNTPTTSIISATRTSILSEATGPACSSPTQRRLISHTRAMSRPTAAADADASPSSSSSTSTSPPQTHYDLFPETLPTGPPPTGPFNVDPRALRREFLQLQARAHPDLHPAAHKARAEATSARINDAYRTLVSPLPRAQYLLALRGVDVANDESLKVDEPGLLAAVLEAREDIEDAADPTDLDAPRAANDARIATAEAALDAAFAADDVSTAKKEAVRLRYWVNIKESIDAWERGKPIVLEH